MSIVGGLLSAEDDGKVVRLVFFGEVGVNRRYAHWTGNYVGAGYKDADPKAS